MTYVRDAVLFGVGLALIMRQGGLIFDPPPEIDTELLITGLVLCNVPGLIQGIGWLRGIAPPSSPSGSPPSPQSSPAPSSGE